MSQIRILGLACFISLSVFVTDRPSRAQPPQEGISDLTLEQRLAAQESELRELRQLLTEQPELIQRLPRTTEASTAPSLEPDPATIEQKASIEQRFNAFEKDWDAFKERQKKDKESAAKKPTVDVFGQLQGDYVMFSQDEVSRDSVGDLQDGVDFRRARLGARGKAFDVFNYCLPI